MLRNMLIITKHNDNPFYLQCLKQLCYVIYDIVGPLFCYCVYCYLVSICDKNTFISPHTFVLLSAGRLTNTLFTKVRFNDQA